MGRDPGSPRLHPQACDFRDHHEDLLAAGAAGVFGVSAQGTAYQREAAERLRLPFPLLSDSELTLAGALRLPTFEAGGTTLFTRITLVIRDGVVEHVFYPVFPPGEHAREVLAWLRTTTAEG